MSEWKKYEGTDEQIAEMLDAEHGFTYLDKYQAEGSIMRFADFFDKTHLRNHLETWEVTHYLICNPHPLADMIAWQCGTGQPVWIKICNYDWKSLGMEYQCSWDNDDFTIFETTKPNWNIPGAEYRFTPFGEEK